MAKSKAERFVEIPEGVEVLINNSEVVVKSNNKESKRVFYRTNISVIREGRKIKISSKNTTKRELKMIGTIAAHLKNMIKGIREEFVYKMEICNVHFPMNVKVEGGKVVIKSFLGETIDRTAKILPNVKVDISGDYITITSNEKESAGQTAANIEKASKLKGRDRRIFQDGIFITEKPGRKI